MSHVKFKVVMAVFASGFVGTGVNAKAVEQVATYNSNSNINFVPSTSITKPIDPINPTNPTPETPEPEKPGTVGPLSIDFASNFEFGTQEITTENKVYMAKVQSYKDSQNITPTFVQVTDKRGSNTGWSLNLKQAHQFQAEETLNKVLEGAQLHFKKGTAVTNGKGKIPKTYEVILDPINANYSKVMSAEVTAGSGTWVSRFGEIVDVKFTNQQGEEVVEKRDSGVTLAIPGSSQKDAGVEYNTTLIWQLTNEPGNETVPLIEE